MSNLKRHVSTVDHNDTNNPTLTARARVCICVRACAWCS